MGKNITLKGHSSFGIREGWLTKGIAAVSENPLLFSKENNDGADILGVGSAMAKAIRYWLIVTGLAESYYETVNGKKRSLIRLTELGKMVYEHDMYMENTGTLWALHYNLATNYEGATVWSVFFNTFENEKFSRTSMSETIYEILCKNLDEEEIAVKSLENDCSVLLQMYVGEYATNTDPEDKAHCPFMELDIISKRRNQYKREYVRADRIDALIVFFAIRKYLDRNMDENLTDKERESVSIENLLSAQDSPGRIFGLDRITLNDNLDTLEERGYIHIDRTAGLDTVYITETAPDSADKIMQIHYKGKLKDET